ncbi:MAG: ABC transporter permease [Pyrinomonadaceae bacterium]
MLKLIASRSVQGIIVLLVVSALTFTLLAAAGGDALTALRNDPLISEEALNGLRRIYGLDQPLPVRYVRWLYDILHGRLGYSLFYQAPVGSIIRPRLLHTLLLAAAALVIAWTVSLALGTWAVRRRGGWVDRVCGLVILLAASTPRIVLALVALAVGARTSLFAIGVAPQELSTGKMLLSVIPPAIVLSVPLIALFLAQVRESLRAALREEFVRVARAKGLPERIVVLRHALRAGLNPLITIFGYSLGGVISGSVIVETVLGWQGLGQLSVVAVRNRDVPLLMGVVLVTATAVLLGNLFADVLLHLNDPRLRLVEARRITASSATASTPAA